MLIGVFGGTFDPVHLGHLIAAEQAREQARLDQVVFVPAARPPHKPRESLAPFGLRAEMLALAIAGHPAFRLDDLEKDRPGPSYTADTLEELHRRQPGASFTLILGADCLPELATWRDPARIGHLADIIIVPRSGTSPAERIVPHSVKIKTILEMPEIDIASHDIRRRVAQGRSIRYLVPRAVQCYIETHGLYRVG
jgi:nicotinate-nucleotide adenylyltransferase